MASSLQRMAHADLVGIESLDRSGRKLRQFQSSGAICERLAHAGVNSRPTRPTTLERAAMRVRTPMPLRSGCLWRMSRPLKLKVTGAECCRLSNSPITGYKGSLRGRTADVSPFYQVEELLLIPPEKKPASRLLQHVINSSYGCDFLFFRSRLSSCEPLQPSVCRIGDCEAASE
jgi:hypothetical protein